jgi:outer membrane protein OmpA-like peptidoglycan-associated protein
MQTIDPNLIRESEKELRVPETRAAQFYASPPAAAREMETSFENAASPRGFSWRIPALLVFLILSGFTSFMVYHYNAGTSQRWATEDLAPQTYKGLSGKPSLSETEETSEPKGEPPAPLPVAAAPAGSPLEVVPPDALRINPFARGKIVIFFPYNSNELRKEVITALDQIAQFLKSEKNLKVQITGYTDAVGSVTYNISVSQFRANSVKSYLAGKGVDPANLIAIGLGPKDPLASNDTPEGRQQNRRVEIEPVRD